MRVTLVIQKLVGIRGGAERVVLDLAKALAARGHQVTVVTYDPLTGDPGYTADGVTVVDLFPSIIRVALRRPTSRDQVEVTEHRASARGNGFPISYMKWHLTHGLFARRLAVWLRHHQQDAVVGFLPPAISAVAFAGRKLGDEQPRLIASTHNLPSQDFGPSSRWDQNPIARRRNLWALEEVDAVTVLQAEFIGELPVGARDRAVVLPNAVTRLNEPAGLSRKLRIIGVGRLTDVKRFDVLIRAFERIVDAVPGWEVRIYGDGPERERLVTMVDVAGLQKRVLLAGATETIGEAYDEASILCHPATFEGFGLAVAEAILHGLPVLASQQCVGVNRLVEHGVSGLLVDDVGDPVAAFAAGLMALIEHPLDGASRDDAAERLAACLSPSRIIDEWESLLSPR